MHYIKPAYLITSKFILLLLLLFGD